MPSLQQLFQDLTQIRFGAPAVDHVHRELAEGTQGPTRDATSSSRGEPLPFRERLQLDGVTFTYPGAPRPVHHPPCDLQE